MPPEGFPPPPEEASLALQRIGPDRDELLKHRGILALRIPSQTYRRDGSFKWVLDPFATQRDLTAATWYTDGSMLGGAWTQLRATGFGLVVVDSSGELVGYGFGAPPSRINTAAAAELWAIHIAMSLSPFPPRIKTDCMSILTSASAGTATVTAHNKVLARVWNSIAASADGDVAALVEQGLWQWIPAHLSISAVGQATDHSNQRLTMVDWRANRLVDALAKTGAASVAPAPETVKLVTSAEVLVRHRLAQLAQATHRANNHSVTVLNKEGEWQTKVLRDSVSRPLRLKRTPMIVSTSKKMSKKKRSITAVKAWSARPPKDAAREARAVRASARAAAHARHLDNALKRSAATLSQPCGIDAAKRAQDLHGRIQKKQMLTKMAPTTDSPPAAVAPSPSPSPPLSPRPVPCPTEDIRPAPCPNCDSRVAEVTIVDESVRVDVDPEPVVMTDPNAVHAPLAALGLSDNPSAGPPTPPPLPSTTSLPCDHSAPVSSQVSECTLQQRDGSVGGDHNLGMHSPPGKPPPPTKDTEWGAGEIPAEQILLINRAPMHAYEFGAAFASSKQQSVKQPLLIGSGSPEGYSENLVNASVRIGGKYSPSSVTTSSETPKPPCLARKRNATVSTSPKGRRVRMAPSIARAKLPSVQPPAAACVPQRATATQHQVSN